MTKESEQFRKLFECCICDSHETTRLFPLCLHTICEECVERVKCANGYRCAKCHKISDKLITNGALCKLTCQNSAPNCVWCAEGDETNISQGHCKECDLWLCSECIKGHNRMPTFRSHTIDIVGDCGEKGLMCEIHPQEALELYCETCGVLTCRDCQLSLHRDHGGHRWVKEKAELIRPGLVSSIKSMETEAEKLRNCVESTKNSPADILASVEAAKASHQRAIDDLMRIAKVKKVDFEIELDETGRAHVDKLYAANAIMQNLANRIDYTLRLARFLVDNESKDPASLVQLAGHIEDQLSDLAKRVDELTTLNVPVDENQSNLKDAIGWQKASTSRVHYLPSRSPEEVVNSLSTVFWTSNEMNGDVSLAHNSSNEEDATPPQINNVEGVELGTSEVMDNSSLLHGGCAVCHSSGLLLVCSACSRTFHPQCHLPRLEKSDVLSGQRWTCSLCSSVSKSSSSSSPVIVRRIREMQNGVASPDEGSPKEITWTREQFESGCRILLNLLCLPEAKCFTSSNSCPICSYDLSTSEGSTDAEGSLQDLCDVFHGLSRLRRCLEVSETNGGRSIEQWIRDIDAFTVDTCAKSDDFGVPSVSSTFREAACTLRDTLDSCVSSHYPAFFQA
nr:E3 ubiquitin protein ligase TRIM33 [Hymenolepis microstoma]